MSVRQTLGTATEEVHMVGTAEDIPLPSENSCLTRTCLKWTADGELSAVDLKLVLSRLAQADQQASLTARLQA